MLFYKIDATQWLNLMLLNCGVGEDSWESLDYKEIQPVLLKGNQSWIFIGRIDAEAEMPTLWPPDVKNWLIEKDPDPGKDWRHEEMGTTEDKIVGWHHQLNEYEFEQAPGVDNRQGSLQSMMLQRGGHDWAIELNWTIWLNYGLSVTICLKWWFYSIF